jgi:transcriptional regulator with XRE-family HTH domain
MTDVRIPTWTLGDRLRKAREAAGLRQDDLAPMLHVARATLASWENNKHMPSYLAVLKWAEVTGVPVEWLAEGRTVTGTVTHEYQYLCVGQLEMCYAA